MNEPTFTAAEAIAYMSLCRIKPELKEIWSLVYEQFVWYSGEEQQAIVDAFRHREMVLYFTGRIYLQRPEPTIYISDQY